MVTLSGPMTEGVHPILMKDGDGTLTFCLEL